MKCGRLFGPVTKTPDQKGARIGTERHSPECGTTLYIKGVERSTGRDSGLALARPVPVPGQMLPRNGDFHMDVETEARADAFSTR